MSNNRSSRILINGTSIAEAVDESSVADMYIIILPSIVIFGLCGNVISLVTIFSSRIKNAAANHYLITLTIADSIFLIGLLLILFKLDFVYEFCLAIEYVLGTSSYVSSWSIAALTIERYLALARPFQVSKTCADRQRLKFLSIWIPLAFVVNIVQIASLKYYDDPSDPHYPNMRRCYPADSKLQMIIEVSDAILCYLLPCIAVVVLNLCVARKVRSSTLGFREIAKRNGSRRSGGVQSEPGVPSFSCRILLVVPVVYVLLNTPFYLFRIVDAISETIFKSMTFSIKGGMDMFTQNLYNAAHYLYYINFACDVVVYAFSRYLLNIFHLDNVVFYSVIANID
uniref:G_PROTEIN_RECEP_F1_2 domain-containing protein n=1 Tax=Syphacia muris TaxID=451379 RepID=A0A0N5AIH2_9BILA